MSEYQLGGRSYQLLSTVYRQVGPAADRLGVTGITLHQSGGGPQVIIGFGPDCEVIVDYSRDDCDADHVQRYRLTAWQRKRGDHWLITMTSGIACDGLNPTAQEIGHALERVVKQAAANPLPAKASHELTGSSWITRAYRSLLPRSRQS